MEEIPIIHPSDADLEELVRDVEDVTDPSSINKILEFLELIQKGDDNFMRILTEKLGDAEIHWELPWYQKSFGFSRPHNDTGDDTTFKKNSLTSVDHDFIKKKWCELRKLHELPEDGLTSVARWRNRLKTKNTTICAEEKARQFVLLFLAKGLERRPRQIYSHICTHYGPSRRGFYTRTEDKIIEICFHHRPSLVREWLAQVLGREPASVRKKMHIMHNGKPIIKEKRLKWTLPLATKFLKLLMKHTGLELEALKNRRFEFDVWQQLESDMDQHHSFLQHFWYCYLHVQLFARCDVKLRRLTKQLFKRLLHSSYSIWSDIDWKELVLDFPDGFTHRFIFKICLRMAKHYNNGHFIKAPLKEVAEYALQKARRRRRKRNKRLKTLRLNENGDLELADYKVEK